VVSDSPTKRNYIAKLTILVCFVSILPLAKKAVIWLLQGEQAVAQAAKAWQPWSIVDAFRLEAGKLLPGAKPDGGPKKAPERKTPPQVAKQTGVERARSVDPKPPPPGSKLTDLDHALDLGPLIDENGNVKPLPPASKQTDLEHALELQKELGSNAGMSKPPLTEPLQGEPKAPNGNPPEWWNRLLNWLGQSSPLRGWVLLLYYTVVLPIQTTYSVAKDLLAGDSQFYGLGVLALSMLVGLRTAVSERIKGFWVTLGVFWLAFFAVTVGFSIVAWLLQLLLLAGPWPKILAWAQGASLTTLGLSLAFDLVEGGHKTIEFVEASEKLGMRIPLLTKLVRRLK